MTQYLIRNNIIFEIFINKFKFLNLQLAALIQNKAVINELNYY